MSLMFFVFFFKGNQSVTKMETDGKNKLQRFLMEFITRRLSLVTLKLPLY